MRVQPVQEDHRENLRPLVRTEPVRVSAGWHCSCAGARPGVEQFQARDGLLFSVVPNAKVGGFEIRGPAPLGVGNHDADFNHVNVRPKHRLLLGDKARADQQRRNAARAAHLKIMIGQRKTAFLCTRRDYCLSKTMVAVTGLPAASVPVEVCVRVLPSLEMTVRPVMWYFPPVLRTSQFTVFASIRLTEMVSNCPPVAGYSLPSYLKV